MHEILERLESELVVVLIDLDPRKAQLAPPENPGKWTIQQIVEHLLLTFRSTVRLVQGRLEKGTPTQTKPTLLQRAGQLTVIRLGYFPPGRRAPEAVCPTMPASLRSGEEMTRALHEDLLAMDQALSQAESVFGAQHFATHSVLGPLSAAQWRKFHLVHGRHHVNQIRQIRRDWQTRD